MSDAQHELLKKRFSSVILLLDGDAAGLVHSHYITVIALADGKQPDRMSSAELREVLA